ncbi:superfamily II DNA or RNA helicase [Natronospira proteinivora]|uniref:Superfamily II DNA or RNA helicase n=2 Tax=Natronospira proteinivora TaxID=1807133 RepID=A0ABT1G9N1_9GAMM|nr:DEAD/DEAH box helicase family protein [Natronospira proteinivora]MCP1727615.1 superfamily II DNA or RNA helicase [Natronospira proteinivora]
MSNSNRLKEFSWKAVYSSDVDDFLEDFYFPVLKCAAKYDRSVGYFTSGIISAAAKGLSNLIESDGKMRLIFNGEVSDEDLEAIKTGYGLKSIESNLEKRYFKVIDNIGDYLVNHRLDALSWLIASGQLDIRIALRPRGIFHEKVGIVYDWSGDCLVFSGSSNETAPGVMPDFNFESVNVFYDWNPAFRQHVEMHREKFERLWDNKAKGTFVTDFPNAVKERLIRRVAGKPIPNPDVEVSLWRRISGREEQHVKEEDEWPLAPTIPDVINGQPYQLRDHQYQGLYSWKGSDYRGVLEYATGSGKTIMACHGLVKLFEALKQLFVVISVPYQNLADQWVDVLQEFGVAPIRCYRSSDQWRDKLSSALRSYQLGALELVCCVVVNRTLSSDSFQSKLKEIPGDDLLFIGDECHHLASKSYSSTLPMHARYRLGLSATPTVRGSSEMAEQLSEYFGDIVSRYGLADALQDEVLTPYRYYLECVRLEEDESDEYISLSDEIARLYAAESDGSDIQNTRLKALLGKRAQIVAHSRQKLRRFSEQVEVLENTPYTLVYCGAGTPDYEDCVEGEVSHLESVAKTAYKAGWSVGRFTSKETLAERRKILQHFVDGRIRALLAIRCLDEGVDVPACRRAFILASSSNPRQFIQRRGRILRRAPGKDFAEIYDYLVLLSTSHESQESAAKNLLKREVERVVEFAMLAENWQEAIDSLHPYLKAYDLDHLTL